MIEDFSGGYYRKVMDVQEYDDGPVIERELYDFIHSEVYTDPTAPVMMRIGLDPGKVFSVDSETVMPRDVLAVPPHLANETGETNVFILKSEYTNSVSAYHG